MQKKNKVMLAAAVGMVAIVVASTAMRCSLSHVEAGREDAEAPAVQEQADEREDVPAQNDNKAPDATPSAAEEVMALLQGTSWVAPDDPGTTIAFRDGSFVESGAGGVRIAAFQTKAAGSAAGQRFLDVDVMREGASDLSTTIVVDGADGALAVSSDAFALTGRYVQGDAAGTPVEVSGLVEPYLGLIDGKDSELTSALDAWCAAHAPTAKAASFDGEVYVDVRGDRTSATFHLDDAAASIVTVVYSGGSFDVLG